MLKIRRKHDSNHKTNTWLTTKYPLKPDRGHTLVEIIRFGILTALFF